MKVKDWYRNQRSDQRFIVHQKKSARENTDFYWDCIILIGRQNKTKRFRESIVMKEYEHLLVNKQY